MKQVIKFLLVVLVLISKTYANADEVVDCKRAQHCCPRHQRHMGAQASGIVDAVTVEKRVARLDIWAKVSLPMSDAPHGPDVVLSITGHPIIFPIKFVRCFPIGEKDPAKDKEVVDCILSAKHHMVDIGLSDPIISFSQGNISKVEAQTGGVSIWIKEAVK